MLCAVSGGCVGLSDNCCRCAVSLSALGHWLLIIVGWFPLLSIASWVTLPPLDHFLTTGFFGFFCGRDSAVITTLDTFNTLKFYCVVISLAVLWIDLSRPIVIPSLPGCPMSSEFTVKMANSTTATKSFVALLPIFNGRRGLALSSGFAAGQKSWSKKSWSYTFIF